MSVVRVHVGEQRTEGLGRKSKALFFCPPLPSVATWAINQGADPATVAAFLNRKRLRTTMRFYATHATA